MALRPQRNRRVERGADFSEGSDFSDRSDGSDKGVEGEQGAELDEVDAILWSSGVMGAEVDSGIVVSEVSEVVWVGVWRRARRRDADSRARRERVMAVSISARRVRKIT